LRSTDGRGLWGLFFRYIAPKAPREIDQELTGHRLGGSQRARRNRVEEETRVEQGGQREQGVANTPVWRGDPRDDPTLRGRASAGRFAPPRSRGLVTFCQMRGARRQGAMAGRCEVTAPCAGIVCSRSVSG